MDVGKHFNIIRNGAESRRDQEEGGELDSHEKDTFAGPGEIKRREVSWTLTQKLDTFAGPGEIKRREVVLDPQESPEEIKSREVVLDPQESQEEIKSREVVHKYP